MRKWSRVLVAVVVVVLIVAVWWHRGSGTSRQPARGDVGALSATRVTRASPRSAGPAHVTVTVTDAKGPLAGATVRLAARDGDVTLATTDRDGRASSELAPGRWQISASALGHSPAASPSRDLGEDERAQIDLVLAAGGRPLSGVITDATGGPIGGARIDAAPLDTTVHASDAIAATTSDADGKYAMTVPEGRLLVAASDPDYASQSRYVEVGPAGATASFQLVPGGVIDGIVRDAHTREPVAGATVIARRDARAMWLGGRTQRSAVSDAQGRFHIAGVRPGNYDLAATAGFRASRKPTLVGLGVAEQVVDVEVFVDTALAIRGVVLDEHDQRVAGVALLDRGVEVGTSDASGAFELVVDPGHHALVGRGAGVIPTEATQVAVTTTDVENVQVRVNHGTYVEGHVEPRQICEVGMVTEQDMFTRGLVETVAAMTTGPDGAFRLGPQQPGPFELAATCAGGAYGTVSVLVAVGMHEATIHVTDGASIAGRVVDTAGKPYGGVTVLAVLHTGSEEMVFVDGMPTFGIQRMTDGDGRFDVHGLRAGDYTLHVLDRGRPLPLHSPESATHQKLAAGARRTVELVAERPDGVIRGVVTDGAGTPIADAWVTALPDSSSLVRALTGPFKMPAPGHSGVVVDTTQGTGGAASEVPPVLTDASGRFEIAGLTRGVWDILAEGEAGKLRGRKDDVTPDATVTVQVARVAELRGFVHAGKATPVAFEIELAGPTRSTRKFGTPDGTFSFGRVDPGDYLLRASADEGHGSAEVHVTAGEPASVDIELAPDGTVIGKVVGADGKPDAQALVGMSRTVQGHEEMEYPRPVEADGSFRRTTPAGKCRLTVMSHGDQLHEDLVLDPGRTLDVGTLRFTN
jgi:hypothetical protein